MQKEWSIMNISDNIALAIECISESIKLEIQLGFSILFWDTRKEGQNSWRSDCCSAWSKIILTLTVRGEALNGNNHYGHLVSIFVQKECFGLGWKKIQFVNKTENNYQFCCIIWEDSTSLMCINMWRLLKWGKVKLGACTI